MATSACRVILIELRDGNWQILFPWSVVRPTAAIGHGLELILASPTMRLPAQIPRQPMTEMQLQTWMGQFRGHGGIIRPLGQSV